MNGDFRGDGHIAERVALVTGADVNLGREMSLALLRRGHRVILSSISEEGLERFRAEEDYPADKAHFVVADLSSEQSRQELVESCVRECQRVDILVNNAGVTPETFWPSWLVDGEPQSWSIPVDLYRTFLEIDTIAPHALIAATVPGMIERGWGRVINVTTGLKTMLSYWPYGSAKAALEAETVILAEQLTGTGVTANVLVPGGFAKPAPIELPGGQIIYPQLSPEVMAEPVCWLASDASAAINGQRVIGCKWDPALPAEEALKAAAAPAGWDLKTVERVEPVIG